MELQYAILNGLRTKPQKGLVGECPNCGSEVISKCGQERVHHWSHKGRRKCDPWHENETQWHRDWKSLFPDEWHEISHKADDGERHIADLKRPDGLVVEIQYSHIDPVERKKREEFYRTIVWIVSGLRLKRGIPGFEEAFEYGRLVYEKPLIFSVYTSDSQLLRKWVKSNGSVYFDFGDHLFETVNLGTPREPVLWRLDPSSSEETSYLTPILKSTLVSDIAKVKIGQRSKSALFDKIILADKQNPRVANIDVLSSLRHHMINTRRRRRRPRF